jgi:Transcriptional regulatory protein, C terminal
MTLAGVSTMRDNTNDLGRLHGRDLIAVDKTEQAMAWLISQGPVVEHPPLPAWITKKLVAARRIMRLRRDAYLVPDASGRLPSLPRAMNLLDPSCYVSGHGALAAQGLNDQDIAVWWSVGNRRQADISYGLFRAHFVVSPESAKHGEYHVVTSDGDRVKMATPAQALVDEAHHDIRVAGVQIELSPREYSLLECLMRHPDQVLTRDQLLDHAWPFVPPTRSGPQARGHL